MATHRVSFDEVTRTCQRQGQENETGAAPKKAQPKAATPPRQSSDPIEDRGTSRLLTSEIQAIPHPLMLDQLRVGRSPVAA